MHPLNASGVPALHSSPGTPLKRNFLRLPVAIEVDRLLADYASIPPEAWGVSHWNVHCSSAMVLLRGGGKGTEEDFVTSAVEDSALLRQLPYLSQLVSDQGPFGQCTYAFIFRMKPMGVARPHTDDEPAWRDPFRLHVPITTNPGALLLAERRSKHLPVGEVWTFDNQSWHGAVNGESVRAHLIIDVPLNPRLESLLGQAQWDPGQEDPHSWRRAELKEPPPSLAIASGVPLSVSEKEELGLRPDGFACRIVERRWTALLSGTPLAVGDVLYAVNGIEECVMARTALDYLHLRHRPGETLELGLIRQDKRIHGRARLLPNALPEPVRRLWWRASNALRRA